MNEPRGSWRKVTGAETRPSRYGVSGPATALSAAAVLGVSIGWLGGVEGSPEPSFYCDHCGQTLRGFQTPPPAEVSQ